MIHLSVAGKRNTAHNVGEAGYLYQQNWLIPTGCLFYKLPPLSRVFKRTQHHYRRGIRYPLQKYSGIIFAFLDTSDLEYIGMQRNFNSFYEAAAEVSISRVYGGIHTMHSVKTGMDQVKK